MSKKDVDEYYNQICRDYFDAINTIKEFESDMENGLIAPEKVERFKESFAPIMENYKLWSFIMYLYNKPVRKSKVEKYEKQNKNKLKIVGADVLKNQLSDNKEALKKMKEFL